MDAKITELLEKLKVEKGAVSKFLENPTELLKEHGIEIPTDKIEEMKEEAKGLFDKMEDKVEDLFHKDK